MSDPDENTSTEWEELVKVGKYPTLEQAQEHGLVILAMREPCWVAEDQPSGGFSLHAVPEAAPVIARELSAYESEQQQAVEPPAADREIFHHRPGWEVFGIWAISLIGMFLLQNADPTLVDRAASSSRGLIGDHEWWRPFTALFLHGDFPHLIGNLLSGLFFGTLVARSIGPWLGWALILACGAIGNSLTSALTWPEPFTSIGASTAVFGALGILSGLGFATLLRARHRLPWAKLTAPLVAGIILLGWLGGGAPGGNTDVLGHVFGFASGLGAGLLISRLSPAIAGASTAGTSMEERGEPT
jgi:membrane associated rhomboid family serine protease